MWQLSHERAVIKCPFGLVVALMPLWQAMQLLAGTPLWLNCAGVHALVRWQVSHEVVTIKWRAGKPDACCPSWQDLH